MSQTSVPLRPPATWSLVSSFTTAEHRKSLFPLTLHLATVTLERVSRCLGVLTNIPSCEEKTDKKKKTNPARVVLQGRQTLQHSKDCLGSCQKYTSRNMNVCTKLLIGDIVCELSLRKVSCPFCGIVTWPWCQNVTMMRVRAGHAEG